MDGSLLPEIDRWAKLRNRVIDEMVLTRARGMERTSGAEPPADCERYTMKTLPTFIGGFRLFLVWSGRVVCRWPAQGMGWVQKHKGLRGKVNQWCSCIG